MLHNRLRLLSLREDLTVCVAISCVLDYASRYCVGEGQRAFSIACMGVLVDSSDSTGFDSSFFFPLFLSFVFFFLFLFFFSLWALGIHRLSIRISCHCTAWICANCLVNAGNPSPTDLRTGVFSQVSPFQIAFPFFIQQRLYIIWDPTVGNVIGKEEANLMFQAF